METLQRRLEKALRRIARSKSLSDQQLDALIEEGYSDWIEVIANDLHDVLQAQSKEMLTEQAKHVRAFERRNKRRWKRPIDQLKIMLRMIEECAEGLVKEWNRDYLDQPFTFGALNHSCVKGLMTARECICLMEGGFADGALARWRSLHEIAVTSLFISGSGELTAERFIASFRFKSKKAMSQLNEHAERAKLTPFKEAELREIEAECADLEVRLGAGLGDDYGWARGALGLNRKPNLHDIEKEVGLDHWRPRYRWSSQNIHSGYRPPHSSLGMAEARSIGHLTGQSNSGMVDPIHMVAISMLIVATAFLAHWPNTDRLVAVRILDRISKDVGPLALRAEADSAKRAERRFGKNDD